MKLIRWLLRMLINSECPSLFEIGLAEFNRSRHREISDGVRARCLAQTVVFK